MIGKGKAMKHLLYLTAALGTVFCQGAGTDPAIGEVVYRKDFAEGWNGWAPKPRECARFIPDGRGGTCVEVTAGGQGGEGAVGNRDVLGVVEKSGNTTFLLCAGFEQKLQDRIKGYELEVAADLKAENVPVPPRPWDGVHLQVNYATTTGPYSHNSYCGLHGTFDWKTVSWHVRIPTDMTNMSLSLGLISPSGKLWIENVRMTVTDLPFARKTPPGARVYKGYSVPCLRGFVTGIREPGSEGGRKSLDKIANEWQANAAKLWFHLSGPLEEIDAKLAAWMDSVEAALPTARQDRLYLILHLASGWRNKEHGSNELFYEQPEYAAKFVEVWETIARRFKGCPEIYAFELLNESCLRLQPAPGCPDYPELMERAAKAVNAIDPARSMIVQTEEWWGARAFTKMRPIDARNIVYALHFYSPFPVSHQGISEWYAKETSWKANAYPGTYDGVRWDKNTLRRELQPVLDFQKACNCQIIVSEFSCVRWALGDSRRKLIKDMTDLYEEFGWDWLYHGYPEYTGWMPDEGCDPWNGHNPACPSTVEPLLKGLFAKNERPVFPAVAAAVPKVEETTDRFAGIDFWKDDQLHIPNFAASRNLVQNPSFEAGLHYYRDLSSWSSWPGVVGREIFGVDESQARSGKRSLKISAYPDYGNPSYLATFTIPTIPGREYTFSFYAKGADPRTTLHLRVMNGVFRWSDWGETPFRLTTEWQRYTHSFVAPNNAAVLLLAATTGVEGGSPAWVDDLQFEQAAASTDYVDASISVALLSSAKEGILTPGTPIDARLRIHAVPGAKGHAAWEVEDFYCTKPASGGFDFACGGDGETTVPIDLDGRLGKGFFVLRTDVTLEAGTRTTEFHRLAIMDAAPEHCPNKGIFAIAEITTPARPDAYWRRLAFLGFGSSCYVNRPLEAPLLEKYGLPNSACGIAGYGSGPTTDAAKEFRRRLKEEPYSEELRALAEQAAYDMAKAYPWVRAWFIQAESSCDKIGCLRNNDTEGFAKLILACRAGVRKADSTLQFLPEGGPCNMYPAHGVADYDKWLSALEKVAPDVRFDAFAIHPYRPTPENPDLDHDAEAFLKMLERHGYKTEPIYWNEGLYNGPWHIPEWGLDVHKGCTTDHWYAGTPTYHMGWAERMSAAYWARGWLVALKYADRVKQFTGWWDTLLLLDVEGNHYALAKVPNTLCHLFGDARFCKDIRFAVNSRAYVFEDAQQRPVAAVWSYIPAVDRGQEAPPVARMAFSGDAPEFIDLMENTFVPARSTDGASEVPLTPFPFFLRGKAGSLDALCAALAQTRVPGSRDFPLTVELKPASQDTAQLSFVNRFSRDFVGVAKLPGQEAELQVPANGTASFQIKLPQTIPVDAIANLSLPLTLEQSNGDSFQQDFSLRAFAVPQAGTWDDVPWHKLTNRKVTKTRGTSGREVKVDAGYPGDQEAEFKLRWDAESLYLLVNVVDDKAVLPEGAIRGADYPYDSLQIYLDTYGDNGDQRGVFGDFNDYCYQIALDRATGKPRVYREAAPEQQVAGGMDAPKRQSIDTEADVTITQTANGYLYDIRFPARIVAPFKLCAGSFARFGLTVHDNDGDGHKSALVTTETPGSEPFSNPEQWTGIVLAPGEPLRSQLEAVSDLTNFTPSPDRYRIYFIGDSITRHGFNQDTIDRLKWDHLAGMAASSETKDYAHLLASGIQKLVGKKVKLCFGPGGDAVNALKGIGKARLFQPHLVVVQLGEHVPSKAFGSGHDDSPEKIASDYGVLLDAILALPGPPRVLCTGIWCPSKAAAYTGRPALIDEIQSGQCKPRALPFVSVEKYALDPSCSGTGGSGGVRWHPNDKGQAAYAEELLTVFAKSLQ